MKFFSAVLLSACLILSLSACEPKERLPITVGSSSEAASSETDSSASASSVPQPSSEATKPTNPSKREEAPLAVYVSFAVDFAIAEPPPEKEPDEDILAQIDKKEIVKLTDGICLDLDGDGKGEVIKLAIMEGLTKDRENAESESTAESEVESKTASDTKTTSGTEEEKESKPEVQTVSSEPTGENKKQYLQLTVGNRRIEILSKGPVNELYAAKLSPNGAIQLMTTEKGLGAESYTYFFEYQKSGIWHIGGVEGRPEEFVRTDRGFTSPTKGQVLQSWSYRQEYVISNGDSLSPMEGQYVPSCITPVPMGTYPMGTIVRLKQPLSLLVSPFTDSESELRLPFNQLAVLSASDSKEWVYVTAVEPNPRGGWLRVKPGTFSTCVVGGTEVEAAELFDGLVSVGQ